MDNLASAPSPSNQSQPRRAAVIGSGFGGMAVAIRLQNAGFQTTLFEALDKPGGRAYVFEKDGYTFDGGPTVITAPHCLEELFSEEHARLGDALLAAQAAYAASGHRPELLSIYHLFGDPALRLK